MSDNQSQEELVYAIEILYLFSCRIKIRQEWRKGNEFHDPNGLGNTRRKYEF